jgi:hypothetical protein
VDGLFWSIHELEVFQPGKPIDNKAAAAKKPAAAAFE